MIRHQPPGDDTSLIRRAVAALFQYGDVHKVRETPDLLDSEVRELSGRRYVLLKRDGELLKVYRVATNGLLRAMTRPPRQLLEG